MMPHRGGRGRQDLVSSTFLIAQPHDKDRAQVLRHHTRPEYLIPSGLQTVMPAGRATKLDRRRWKNST